MVGDQGSRWALRAYCALVFSAGFLALSPCTAQVISGDVVDTSTERAAPEDIATTGSAIGSQGPAPFGANLFDGGFGAEREDGLNPEYVVQSGDKITVRLWGATAFSETLIVDAQGNIFIPEVGPVRVAGVRNADLNRHIERAVRRVFTQNINVYTNIESTTPVIAFVAGYVARPGSYAGVASDSLLFFLHRAGGIDSVQGSYRDLRVIRAGRTIATADLYEFMLEGRLPKVQFRDGDTILVGPRRAAVAVEGDCSSPFTFELSAQASGAELMALARPLPSASHATVVGTRSEGPVTEYLPLADFRGFAIQAGDKVIFETDREEATMLVRIEGSHLGPSRFAIPVDAKLHELLNHIEVDADLADIQSISLRRESIARRQKKSLGESLLRLETTVLGASSQTDEEAKIRVQEAELVKQLVARVRNVRPEGVLVVATNGEIADVRLQPGDIVTIPEYTETVLVSGEVMVPQAVVFAPRDSVARYIDRVGGYTERADLDRFLILRRNGEVLLGDGVSIEPGDEILVLPKVPAKSLQLAKTLSEIIFQLAFTAAAAFK